MKNSLHKSGNIFIALIFLLGGLFELGEKTGDMPMRKGEEIGNGYLVSAHQRIDFAEGADFAPPRRGTCSRLEFYAASSCTSTRSNDATPSGASTK